MLFYLSSKIISSAAAFLYPGYASYKTLSQRPASEEDIEQWLMYWAVLGCIVGVEYVAEWLVSWLPLYYPIKTLFLLYLVLPQTRGSSYLYTQHLQPFFDAHEAQIDAALASFKARIYTFVQERIRMIWENITSSIGQPIQATQPVPTQPPPGTTGPAQLASNLWQWYGPTIIASGTALLARGLPPPIVRSDTARAPVRTESSGSTAEAILQRRRELEAELARLPPIPTPSGSVAARAAASTTDLRERTGTGGRFEEIEVPSDVEGYDVGGSNGEGDSDHSSAPAAQGRTSWFDWAGWNASQGKGSYERVKSE